jgi:hypothetical protein
VIPNVTRGGRTHGVLAYLVGKGKREEHTDPHLVAGAPEAVRMAEGRLLERGDAVALARFLDEPREQFGTRVTIAERDGNGKVIGARDAHVWHCSLALHPDESDLPDERWAEICQEFVVEMRFAGEHAEAECRWVAIRHGRSAGGSDHAHLVVALVAEDGSKASVHNDRPRAQKACREIEQRFGLRRLEARERGTGSRGIKPGEQRADARRLRDHGERGEHPERGSRHTLERIVRACATASRTESEFVRALREHGLQVRPRYAPGGTDRVVGYSVRLPGTGEGRDRMVWYGGGRLAKDLTLPALRRSWGQDGDGAKRALAEWNAWTAGAPRSQAEQRAELEERGVMWHRACTDIERIRTQLRAAGADAAACAHAAREGAGVLSAWSLALEGEHPGSLARAARQLARSAELPAHAQQRVGRHGARGSGLALFILAAGKPDGAFGWMLVARELGLLARELGRTHELHGELQRAREIETELSRELDQVRAMLESERPSPTPLDSEAAAAAEARQALARPPARSAEPTHEAEAVRRLLDSNRKRPRRQR